MAGAPDGTAAGLLVAAGLGRTADYVGVAARGAVVLVTRGETPFAEKARAAQEVGAIALLVLNTDPEPFRGDLGTAAVSIPVVGIAGSDGAAIRALLGQRVTVTSQSLFVNGPSQNVVGQPSSAPCVAYLGAHYDSVPAGPGANDNASGTALLLELARARRIDGLCIVAFGSEEVGLFGSRAFVRAHKVQGARFMLNFDMVAKASGPTLIGDPDLAARVLALPAAGGMSLRSTASLGPGASSDHASFIAAGVPALMFYAGNDQFIHTPQDDLKNVTQADLAKFLDLAVAVIDDLFKR
jgi:aminopeptidase YwaD